MQLSVSKRLISFAAVVAMLLMPLLVSAQRTKPRLRRGVRRATVVAPLVPVGTNLKVRLEDTLSSKDSRVGDRFTATVLDPVRFNEGTATGHISSIQKSGKIKGRTSMNLAFDSIRLSDGRSGTLHGYVTRVYGTDAGRADNEGGESLAAARSRRLSAAPLALEPVQSWVRLSVAAKARQLV